MTNVLETDRPTRVVIRGGTLIDGTGAPRRHADLLIEGDRIAQIGDVDVPADAEILEAAGMVVSPGFINVLSHSYDSLQRDPRAASDLLQGVTTEVFGEGLSSGPSQGRMLEHFPIEVDSSGVQAFWPRLMDHLEHLESTGVGPNVASFVGSANLRLFAAGYDKRPLTDEEIQRACDLLESEMRAGALGIGSALVYSPENYTSTEELVAFSRVVARHDGMYISHMRNEGTLWLESIDEVLTIARGAGVRAEIYHLKAAGEESWYKVQDALDKIDAARDAGLRVTADIYPYAAASTSVGAVIPPMYWEGGQEQLVGRLSDPSGREAIKREIFAPSDDFENIMLRAGGPDNMVILGDSDLYPGCAGRKVTDVAHDANRDPIEVIFDLVMTDSEMMIAYFVGNEANARRIFARPWVSVCSDAESIPAEPPFTDKPVHPRSYGAFARVLGRYVREDAIVSLEEGVRRMTSLPAENLRLEGRGRLEVGAFADIAVFDAESIIDHATYEDPHRYATGMIHVLVNGCVEVRTSELTGKLGGRVLRRATKAQQPDPAATDRAARHQLV